MADDFIDGWWPHEMRGSPMTVEQTRNEYENHVASRPAFRLSDEHNGQENMHCCRPRWAILWPS